jgi:hypothetical protein
MSVDESKLSRKELRKLKSTKSKLLRAKKRTEAETDADAYVDADAAEGEHKPASSQHKPQQQQQQQQQQQSGHLAAQEGENGDNGITYEEEQEKEQDDIEPNQHEMEQDEHKDAPNKELDSGLTKASIHVNTNSDTDTDVCDAHTSLENTQSETKMPIPQVMDHHLLSMQDAIRDAEIAEGEHGAQDITSEGDECRSTEGEVEVEEEVADVEAVKARLKAAEPALREALEELEEPPLPSSGVLSLPCTLEMCLDAFTSPEALRCSTGNG